MSAPPPPSPRRLRDLALPFARAARLRCPCCGGRPVFTSWLRMLPSCPTCGISFARGERGYWLGAYFVNLVAVEALFCLLFGGLLWATWPDPPWDFLQAVSSIAMIAAPFLIYPWSHTLFLAVDLVCRPPAPEDFAAPHEPARAVRRSET
jgi:uncharacterized protein (DUF983 family)